MRTATDDSDNICVSILCSRVDYIVPKESKTSDAHSFNLMQPTRAASQRAKKKVEVQQSFNLIQPTLAALTLTIVSNAGTFFQSYVYCIAILLLILHNLYLLLCFWLACLNYPTFCICNQPCIAFIYFLFISCFFRQMEKEPLPQSVEVLSHAAARAATFLVLATIWLRQCRIIIQSYVAAQATFAFSCRCYKSYPVSILCSHTGSDMMAEIPSAIMSVSILCSRTDCDTKVPAMKNNNVKFQSYAAMQTAMFIMATKQFQSYASLIGCFSFFLS